MENDSVGNNPAYFCWLNYQQYRKSACTAFAPYCRTVSLPRGAGRVMKTAAKELCGAAAAMFGFAPGVGGDDAPFPRIRLCVGAGAPGGACGFSVGRSQTGAGNEIVICGSDENGVLYGVFRFLFDLGAGKKPDEIETKQATENRLRMVNQWDNISGDIERGYSGRSIFYADGKILHGYGRVRDYARLLSSVGLNAIVLNNVNVHAEETKFLTEEFLPDLAALAEIFADYGIRVFLSVNFAAPMALGGLKTADPLDEGVRAFWRKTAETVYSYIPAFGGFLVKADSESRPGPFTYGRDHAQGANMLAEALRPHGGIVVWRCFVYNCRTDWRDRSLDRAKAAYENFMPLDGRFLDNVVLQIKNGPMDFQIREPVSPLFGGLEKTNQMMEFQIAQEYTGHQIDLCYLVPLWKEALDFDTFAKGKNSRVADVVSGKLFHRPLGGIAGVSNIGDSAAWTANPLAQANLFGFGRLAWDPALSSEEIAREWAELTFGTNAGTAGAVTDLLLRSRGIYEKYTCPLGIGWFVNPGCHYGPSVDGYEYSRWGTYHYADWKGLGVDRTAATGTGYAAQYRPENAARYEHPETCPENLLLFFHHLPYGYVLKSGQTILQYIYDTHFEGADEAAGMRREWESLRGQITPPIFEEVCRRFRLQEEDASEWRDVVNTYFYRKTGIPDKKGRKIYP